MRCRCVCQMANSVETVETVESWCRSASKNETRNWTQFRRLTDATKALFAGEFTVENGGNGGSPAQVHLDTW